MGVGAETMYSQITFEAYYSCTWVSFVNQENEKMRNWSLLMKIMSTVPKLSFLYTVYLFSENIINLG